MVTGEISIQHDTKASIAEKVGGWLVARMEGAINEEAEHLGLDMYVESVADFVQFEEMLAQMGPSFALVDLDYLILDNPVGFPKHLEQMSERIHGFARIIEEQGGDFRIISNRLERGPFGWALNLLSSGRVLRAAREASGGRVSTGLDRQNPFGSNHALERLIDEYIVPALVGREGVRPANLVFAVDVNGLDRSAMRLLAVPNEMFGMERYFLRRVVTRLRERYPEVDLEGLGLYFVLVR